VRSYIHQYKDGKLSQSQLSMATMPDMYNREGSQVIDLGRNRSSRGQACHLHIRKGQWHGRFIGCIYPRRYCTYFSGRFGLETECFYWILFSKPFVFVSTPPYRILHFQHSGTAPALFSYHVPRTVLSL
jgi:hypothetical protein